MSTKALSALMGDQIVGYHPILAKVSGGAAEGVLLSQLLYWNKKMEAARGWDWDGWFWKVAHEIYQETGMVRSEFETARANLIKRGFIEYESRGVPARAHYRLNLDAITAALESADTFAKEHARKFLPKAQTFYVGVETEQALDIGSQFVQNGQVENEHVENNQAVLLVSDTTVCPESANWNAQNVQTIHEITSLDSQKNPLIEEKPLLSKTDIQTEIKSLFRIHAEFAWDWLDALVLEIPDFSVHIEAARRCFNLGKPNSAFDPFAYKRHLRAAAGRKTFKASHAGAT